MRSSTLLSVAAATLVSASPMASPIIEPYQFKITDFNFGCHTPACGWNFRVKVNGVGMHHPEVAESKFCIGTLDDTPGYSRCQDQNGPLAISAYIDKATRILKLMYEVHDDKRGTVVIWKGERQVFTSTGPQAWLQPREFTVAQTQVGASV